MEPSVGVSTPWDLWDLPHDEQRARLAQIADLGIDHLFTADHVSFIDGSGMDGLVMLAAMSGLEPRLDLHVGVFLLALRHPMVAARQIASLAQAAPGRLTVGVGVGGEDRHEIEVCGVDPASRGRRTDSCLDVVRRVLDGETVSVDDDFLTLTDALIKPAPRPRVPFLVGGRSDAAVERAGRLGDGWLAAWCSSRRFAEGVQRAEHLGADRDVMWNHGLQVWVGVGGDVADARQHVAAGMENFYKLPFAAFEKYTPMGSAEQIADFLAPYVLAGARTLNLTPCGADRHVELETIAEVKRLLSSVE
ncbi:MAG: LLM class flavin-dependent oxidoreductase [Ilumatobacter sp.]